jgi:protein SCO1/2
MKMNYRLLGIGIVLGLAMMLVGWRVLAQPYKYQGSLIDPPAPAADFQLTTQHGEVFRLSEQRGKIVLIFFGYTHCPDVCPVSLSEFKQIKNQLGDLADQVEFVFITVDPERDTAEYLGQYLANFDPTFIGLSGTPEQLEPVYKSYGVYHQKVETGSAAGYLVDHTARMYIIDAQGNWRLTYPFGMEVEKQVEDLVHLLRDS